MKNILECAWRHASYPPGASLTLSKLLNKPRAAMVIKSQTDYEEMQAYLMVIGSTVPIFRSFHEVPISNLAYVPLR